MLCCALHVSLIQTTYSLQQYISIHAFPAGLQRVIILSIQFKITYVLMSSFILCQVNVYRWTARQDRFLKKVIYSALNSHLQNIQAGFLHSFPLWSASCTHINKLQKLQNIAARLISLTNNRATKTSQLIFFGCHCPRGSG